MIILVDGNNTLMAWPALEPLNRASTAALSDASLRLVAAIGRYHAGTARAHRIIVVFDGPPRPAVGEMARGEGIEVNFGAGESADRLILEEADDIKGREPNAEILVVTSDRALARQAEWLGARVMAPRTFETEVAFYKA
ncbi:MAG: NYN domain-containing protein [bacterium]